MAVSAFTVDNDQKRVLLDRISAIIARDQAQSLLDIGAGHPLLAVPLSRCVERYLAIEADPGRAKGLRDAGLAVSEGPFPVVHVTETFDLVLSSHSIPEQVELYRPFLTQAWELVNPDGALVIITFKGVQDDLEDLTNLLRTNRVDDDRRKYQAMMDILPTLGIVTAESIVSHSRSTDIEEMANLLTFSVGGTADEKKSYRQRLKNLLEERYRMNDSYAFPHEHLVLRVH
jgi:hypothetical protein